MDEEIRPRLAGSTGKELRNFSLGLCAMFAFLAFIAWRKGAPDVMGLLGVAAGICALIALLRPTILRPVYRDWMRIAGVLAAANTLLLMALVFYLMITPYALIMRLLGREALDEEWSPGPSYWRPKEPERDYRTYERQF